MNIALGRLQARAAEWARRRQGPDAMDVTLARRRIYILPTRYGLVFAVLVFAMLLGSMNYSTSLGFALAFLLAGLGLVALHHCHANLLGTRLRFAAARPVFAGQEARFQIEVSNGGALPKYEIELEAAGVQTPPVDLEPGAAQVLELGLPTQRRGWISLPRLSVATRHPGNLSRAWTWVHMDAHCLVYPAPAPLGRPVPRSANPTESGGIAQAHGNADFAGLRDAVPGDPPRRIAWKAYARTGALLVKQFAGAEAAAEVFEWESLPELGPEQRLSQLARWCLDAHAAGLGFGLALPGRHIGPGTGERQLHECLAALALFDLSPAPS